MPQLRTIEADMLPCPFCGQGPIAGMLIGHRRTDELAMSWRCGHCFVVVTFEDVLGIEDAIERWNLRARGH